MPPSRSGQPLRQTPPHPVQRSQAHDSHEPDDHHQGLDDQCQCVDHEAKEDLQDAEEHQTELGRPRDLQGSE